MQCFSVSMTVLDFSNVSRHCFSQGTGQIPFVETAYAYAYLYNIGACDDAAKKAFNNTRVQLDVTYLTTSGPNPS